MSNKNSLKRPKQSLLRALLNLSRERAEWSRMHTSETDVGFLKLCHFLNLCRKAVEAITRQLLWNISFEDFFIIILFFLMCLFKHRQVKSATILVDLFQRHKCSQNFITYFISSSTLGKKTPNNFLSFILIDAVIYTYIYLARAQLWWDPGTTSQRNSGCFIPGSPQGQVGQGFD